MRRKLVLVTILVVAVAAVAHYLYWQPVPLTLQFKHAAGLSAGSPIRAQGVRIGEVVEVELATGGFALAHVKIDKKALARIPDDSVALLAPGGVDLILGDSPQTIHRDGTLAGYPNLTEFRVDAAREALDELLDQVGRGATELGRTLQEEGQQLGEALERELEILKEKLRQGSPPEEPTGEPSESI